MTQENMVAVLCSGIPQGQKAGFALSPLGFEPTYVEFQAGQPTPLKKPYADYLIAQDPTRFFSVDKTAKQEEPAPEAKPEAQEKKGRKAKLKK